MATPTILARELRPDGVTVRITWSEAVSVAAPAATLTARPGGRPAITTTTHAILGEAGFATATESILSAPISGDEDCMIDVAATMVRAVSDNAANAASAATLATNNSGVMLDRPPLHSDLSWWASDLKNPPSTGAKLALFGDSTASLDAANRAPDGAIAAWDIPVSGWLCQTSVTASSALGVAQFYSAASTYDIGGVANDLDSVANPFANICAPPTGGGSFKTFTAGANRVANFINVAARTYGQTRFSGDASGGIGLNKYTLQGGSSDWPSNKFNNFKRGSWRDGNMSIDALVWFDPAYSLRSLDVFANRTAEGAAFNLYGTFTQAFTHSFNTGIGAGLQKITAQCNGTGEPSLFFLTAAGVTETGFNTLTQGNNCILAPLYVRFYRTDLVGVELGFFGWPGWAAEDAANASAITDTAFQELLKQWAPTHVLIDLGKNLRSAEYSGGVVQQAFTDNIVAFVNRVFSNWAAVGAAVPKVAVRVPYSVGEATTNGLERDYMRQVENAVYNAVVALRASGKRVAFANLMRRQRYQAAKAGNYYAGGTDWVHQSATGAAGFEAAFWSIVEQSILESASGKMNSVAVTL